MPASCGSGGRHDGGGRMSAGVWSRPWARAFAAAASLPVGCWRVIAADSTVGGGAGVHHTGRPTGEPTVSGTVRGARRRGRGMGGSWRRPGKGGARLRPGARRGVGGGRGPPGPRGGGGGGGGGARAWVVVGG